MPVPRTESIPLSYAQERLWFLDQLMPGSAAYNVPYALRIRGPLEIEVLEHAVKELVGRHEVLRTTFEVREGEPVQNDLKEVLEGFARNPAKWILNLDIGKRPKV